MEPLNNGGIAANSLEVALATLQPIRDLAKNWDIDIASWLVLIHLFVVVVL